MSGDLIQCVFDGKVFAPQTPFHQRRAAEKFGAGEVVIMEAQNERSMRSHRHYFASLHDLWSNLPERYALEPWAQSAEHLRKRSLIKLGYNESQTFACGTNAEAVRWAQNMQPIDAYSLVIAKGSTVVRFTAESQSVKAMGAERFQQSKEDVLRYIETELLGVTA